MYVIVFSELPSFGNRVSWEIIFPFRELWHLMQAQLWCKEAVCSLFLLPFPSVMPCIRVTQFCLLCIHAVLLCVIKAPDPYFWAFCCIHCKNNAEVFPRPRGLLQNFVLRFQIKYRQNVYVLWKSYGFSSTTQGAGLPFVWWWLSSRNQDAPWRADRGDTTTVWSVQSTPHGAGHDALFLYFVCSLIAVNISRI